MATQIRSSCVIHVATMAFLAVLLCRTTLVANEPFRVVGYLPEYRLRDWDAAAARLLTDIVFFSADAPADGELKWDRLTPDGLRKLRDIRRQHGVKLLLCVGGWERSQGFPQLAASQSARRNFAAAAAKFCREHDFDGIDIDWEHPANDAELQNFAALLRDVRAAFRPLGLTLTIAQAGWQRLPAEAYAAVDRVHLMSYDAEGRHATFAAAEADVTRLLGDKITANKICLGLPFYGRGIQDRGVARTYAEIIQQHQPAADVDEVAGIYFNGSATIEKKTRLALDRQLGGVMIWEVGQDTTDARSLLGAIRRIAPLAIVAKPRAAE